MLSPKTEKIFEEKKDVSLLGLERDAGWLCPHRAANRGGELVPAEPEGGYSFALALVESGQFLSDLLDCRGKGFFWRMEMGT